MNQPRRLFNLFKAISSSAEPERFTSITGNASVDQVIRILPSQELAKLLRYARDWNTTARTSVVAQTVLHAIFKLRTAEDIRAAFDTRLPLEPHPESNVSETKEGVREVVEALIPYTERHFARLDRMMQDSYVLDFLIGEMDGGVVAFDEDVEEDGWDGMVQHGVSMEVEA